VCGWEEGVGQIHNKCASFPSSLGGEERAEDRMRLLVLFLLIVPVFTNFVFASDDTEIPTKSQRLDAFHCFIESGMAHMALTMKLNHFDKDELLQSSKKYYSEKLHDRLQEVINRIYLDSGTPKETEQSSFERYLNRDFDGCIEKHDLTLYRKKMFYCVGFADVAMRIFQNKANGVSIQDTKDQLADVMERVRIKQKLVDDIYSKDQNNSEYKMNLWMGCAQNLEQDPNSF
jgi:hypothetical protein